MPEFPWYALVQHDDVEGLFLSEVFEVLREEQRPGLVGSHALHQAVDGGVCQQGHSTVSQAPQLDLRALRVGHSSGGQVQCGRHEGVVGVGAEGVLVTQGRSSLSLLWRGQQHEVASGSHVSTLSRHRVSRSNFYRLDGDVGHCVGATDAVVASLVGLACASGGWVCGACLPASSPLRGEAASPAGSPPGTPAPPSCPAERPSSDQCATGVLCLTPEAEWLELVRGGR